MIAYCRDYVKNLLMGLNIIPVYTRPEDANIYKGLVYSMVEPGREQLKYVNQRVSKEDSVIPAEGDQPEIPITTYRYKIYESTLPMYVTIIGKNLTQAETFRQSFLTGLGNRFMDPSNNAVLIEATECETLIETGSIQNPREGYLLTIMFAGGVYKDKIVHRITGDIVPVPEI